MARPLLRRSRAEYCRAASPGQGHAGAERHQEAQALGERQQGRGGDQHILAAAAGWQQDAMIAELVGCLRDLAQAAVVHRPAALGRAQVVAIPASRQDTT